MGVVCHKTPLDSVTQRQYGQLLAECGLRDEGDAEVVAMCYDDDEELVACGARSGKVIKQLATSSAATGQGVCSQVVSELITQAFAQGVSHLFLCTKPSNKRMFASLGFFPLVESGEAVLMENRKRGLDTYLEGVRKAAANSGLAVEGARIGAVVANCNPFTIGHQHLMEVAAGVCDLLHIFVVSEDVAQFTAAERFSLVQVGVSHIDNCLVHQSADYLVSRSTFPAYFIKDEARVDAVRADLDLLLFAQRIAPALGITRRFVGDEPFCPTTRAYNVRMHELLPPNGIDVVEIERFRGISARRVRALMSVGDLAAIREMVPEATYELVASKLNGNAGGAR